jgi:hypothetical protein
VVSNTSVGLAWRNEGNMALYAVDVRDRVIQRVTQGYNGVDNKRFFLIEAGFAKQAWAKAYSDYWICHCCGELNRRVQNLHLREVSNGLGEN